MIFLVPRCTRWGHEVGLLFFPRAVRGFGGPLLWLAVLGLADLAVRIFHVPSYVIPAPSEVLLTFLKEWRTILDNALITTIEILAGFFLALALALFTALVFLGVPWLRRAFFPLVVAAQAFPKEAIAPVLIMWMGFAMMPKILLAAAIAFFPIFAATLLGLERFDPKLKRLAETMGAGPIRTFFSYRAWAALPSFFSALRVGISLSAVGAIVGEFLGSDNGIGYLALSASRNLDGNMLFASLAVLVALCLFLIASIDRLERWLLPASKPR